MSEPKIEINKRIISANHSPYVIADLSANHNGNIETAMKIIEEAKKAGADAVKLQTYTAETITLNSIPASSSINFLLSEPDARVIGIVGLILEYSRDLVI